MPSTDAVIGNIVSAKEHYDLLIMEGNDPVLDPPPLAAYMDGWDGEDLFRALQITPECRVLEIGVGTGRLALRALKQGCAAFTGMDLSEPTLETARKHLAAYENVRLIPGEFPKDAPMGSFDRIYSSLTFMHIPDKEAAVRKIAALLAPGGRCVLSLDKEQSAVLDMGTRQVRTYPDTPEAILNLLRKAGLRPQPALELERAWLVTADQPQKNC